MWKPKKTTDEFIQDAINIHGDKYDYTSVNYVNTKTAVTIICPNHGAFNQRANSHLAGNGCNECGNASLRRTTNQFIQESKIVHGDKYDYSFVDYKNCGTKVDIICPEHGLFKQRPDLHLNGNGCSVCSCHVSNIERRWLEYIGLPDDNKHRQVSLVMNNNVKYIIDGYNPQTNIVYEFHGDFWHGNPDIFDHKKVNPVTNKTYHELYENTKKKEALIKDSGYSLVVMWENDWKHFL